MSTPQEFIEQNEDKDGIRFSWNVWPSSRLEAKRLIIPIGCMFTPLKPPLQPLNPQYMPKNEPVRCMKNTCLAILNPYCRQRIDFIHKTWICPFCQTRNQFPQNYANISEQNIPIELFPQFTTLEYILPRPPQAQLPPVFLFVVDTMMREDANGKESELSALKDSLQLSLSHMPENALVGIITFGQMIHLHELGSSELCSKSYVFKGTKDYTGKNVEEMLGLVGNSTGTSLGAQQNANSQRGSGRFIQPLSQCDMQITNIIDELQKDPWPIPPRSRPLRSTGAALSVATGLLESAFPNTGARIMLFVNGACTNGPGLIVNPPLGEKTRSHHDMENSTNAASHIKKATRFYNELATRVAAVGHVCDIYACHYDQTGLYEMKALANMTGGHMMLGDSFASSIFKETFLRVFQKNEQKEFAMNFNANIEIKTSPEIKVSGLIGPLVSMDKKSPNVSDNQIGIGGTCQWRLCHIDPLSTIGAYFEVANKGNAAQSTSSQFGLVQFITNFQAMDGSHRLRVTTVARNWANVQTNPRYIAESFDQEAATALMARVAIYRAESDESTDTIRWLDHMLIKLCQRFGEYVKDESSSFNLSPTFRLYPQFMYHLRRSQFLQVFGNSPDETSYYRNIIKRADTFDSLLMIQPTLQKYTLNGGSAAVPLDSDAMSSDCILLLDSFFHILIWHGKQIAAWRNAGYQNQPEHAAFRQLLERPVADAKSMLVDRFPVPRYIDTDHEGSQARFLLAKVNPSTNQDSQQQYGDESAMLLTDDVNLQEFLRHLKNLAVSSST